MIDRNVYDYEIAREIASEIAKQPNCNAPIRLFLGNGFSRAYYGDFGYVSLFDAIKDEKNNERIMLFFERFGTTNFEAVQRFLIDLSYASKVYGFSDDEVIKDYERIRDALAEAILAVHPEKTTVVPQKHKLECFSFLDQFDDIYTVNYDLLLYWVVLQDESLPFGDYFSKRDETPPRCCEYFEDRGGKDKHIFFLHGALHIFLLRGITLKKIWGEERPLIEQIRNEIISNGNYPLVVAEGDHHAKKEHIKGNSYLKHIFSKFEKIKGQLFVFGFSFSDQDIHISNAIVDNLSLRVLWIGIRKGLSENQEIVERAKEMIKARKEIVGDANKSTKGPLEVKFFNTEKMNIWGK